MSTWHPGHERGRSVVALCGAVALSVAALDVALAGRISLLFDICFVLLCAAMAVLVAPRDLFTAGVLPPLVMLGVFVLVAIAEPAAVGHEGDGAAQAVVSGLAHHSVALCVGYAVCLLLLAQRRRVLGR